MPSPQANDKPWQLHPGFHTRPCSTPSHHHNTMILFRGRVILAFGRIVLFFLLRFKPRLGTFSYASHRRCGHFNRHSLATLPLPSSLCVRCFLGIVDRILAATNWSWMVGVF